MRFSRGLSSHISCSFWSPPAGRSSSPIPGPFPPLDPRVLNAMLQYLKFNYGGELPFLTQRTSELSMANKLEIDAPSRGALELTSVRRWLCCLGSSGQFAGPASDYSPASTRSPPRLQSGFIRKPSSLHPTSIIALSLPSYHPLPRPCLPSSLHPPCQSRSNRKRGQLLSVLDRTTTPMGRRLLAMRLNAPSCNVAEIEAEVRGSCSKNSASVPRGTVW